ncbi:hypothetical protein BiPBO1_84 [Brucella phage BiPBO1]|nr:hypothetical protein [Brucella inopinata]YP_009304111.1 hypothetical protein BJD47_gp83 [Brucella phage BiPBO1]ALJ98297.1 hypothetical protein BiPBO1_84 [Brucella phage BiPBO1]
MATLNELREVMLTLAVVGVIGMANPKWGWGALFGAFAIKLFTLRSGVSS